MNYIVVENISGVSLTPPDLRSRDVRRGVTGYKMLQGEAIKYLTWALPLQKLRTSCAKSPSAAPLELKHPKLQTTNNNMYDNMHRAFDILFSLI